MCGFSGFVEATLCRPRQESVALVRRMTDALRHRGPDDRGEWVDPSGRTGFGHRRLAIVDLSPTGHQPMTSADGGLVLAFNGEIYNFRELRTDLESRGHRFRGTSDTEVMLASFREWGLEAALTRFNGMFAFALWDARDRTVILGRDRIGIKPLYYGVSAGAVVFGSELGALRRHPSFQAVIDPDVLQSYMRYGYVSGPRSIYRNVFRLPPGSFVRVTANAVAGEPVKYWSVLESARRGIAEPFRGSESEAVEEVAALLRDAVRRQMIADVPLGAFLSGGIDSSLIASLMQEATSAPVNTFTIGFDRPDHDERRHARAIASHLGTRHTEIEVTASDALALVPRVAEIFDEPFADPSAAPTQLLSTVTRQHVTVALSGDGGDELLAGYDRYRWSLRTWEQLRRFPIALRRLGAHTLARVSRSVAGHGVTPLDTSPGRLVDRIRRKGSLLAAETPDELYRCLLSHWNPPDEVIASGHEAPTILDDLEIRRSIPAPLDRFRIYDFQGYLPDDILTKVDRASMSVGLEARVPLLDHRLVDLAWRLPQPIRDLTKRPKWLFRSLLSRFLPVSLFDRPKWGFSPPIGDWLRGPLREWAEALLDDGDLNTDGFLRPLAVRTAWQQHLSGVADWKYALWNVLAYRAWRRSGG